MKKKWIFIVLIVLISVFVLIIAINNVYIKNSKDKIYGKIETVEYIKDPTEDEYLNSFLNTSVNDNKYAFGDAYNSFSNSEIEMKFDLKSYNVYKISATFQNDSNMTTIVTMKNYIGDNKFIVVPSQIPYINVANNSKSSWEYYVFVSKKYTEKDLIDYLKNQGVDFSAVFQKRWSGKAFDIHLNL